MKYATLIFTRSLSALYRQGIIPRIKMEALLDEWQSGKSSGDYEKIMLLLSEVQSLTQNVSMKKELGQAIEGCIGC